MSNKFKTVSYTVAFIAFCMLLVAPVSAQPAAASPPPSLSTQEITQKLTST